MNNEKNEDLYFRDLSESGYGYLLYSTCNCIIISK